MLSKIERAIREQALPPSFITTVEQWYRPLAKNIAGYKKSQHHTILVGVQGCQGSGKSTLSHFLNIILKEEFRLNAAVLSIDDFYLGKHERLRLAKDVHPLFATRGVPGTHDVDLAITTIEQLQHMESGNSVAIPRFNKASDDLLPPQQWEYIDNPVDIILLEGWCVGLIPEQPEALTLGINALENEEDSQGIWRAYVNNALGNEYQALFRRIELLLVLQAPSFDCVYDWRLLQEEKLISSLKENKKDTSKTMSPPEIKRFISHYQRLSIHALNTSYKKANWILNLDEDHQIRSLKEG